MSATRVEAPNKEFTGIVAGVSFQDGAARTEDQAAIAYFREAGYEVDGKVEEYELSLTGGQPAALKTGKRVHAPNGDYEGIVGGVQFQRGEATVDNPALLSYFREAGYRIEGEKAPKKEEPSPPVIDARDPALMAAPPTKDAAIYGADAAGPMSDAFLPPTNAGLADPHGPLVVSPGLHAVPPTPILPGPVSSDPSVQEEVETALAQVVLVEGQAATVAADPAPVGEGPLGLSDPNSAGEGPDASKATGVTDLTTSTSEQPAKSASKADWVAWVADHHNLDPDEVGRSTKAELVEKYGT